VRLAVSNDPIAQRSGQVLHHQRTARTAPAAQDTTFQDRLLNRLAELTGVELPNTPAHPS
jgi:hypothetical protein